MNTIHMDSEDWAIYIQQHSPANIDECKAFARDLLEYSKQGNIEASIAEFRICDIALKWNDVLEWSEYKRIKRNAIGNQQQIQDGFLNGIKK